MYSTDAIERAIHDRQVRYRHEADRVNSGAHPVREWLGDRLVSLGETVRGRGPNASIAPVQGMARGRLA